MDTNIRNKFITNIFNVDDKDIESLYCIDDSNGKLTLTIKLLRKERSYYHHSQYYLA